MGDRGDFPALVGTDTQVLKGGGAVRGVIGNRGAGEHHFNRTFHRSGGEGRQQRIASQEQLAAKPSADIRGDNTHILHGNFQRFCQIGAAPVNHLI
ncbi:hypothetical protein BvCmsSINP031_03948 [Escherichia coli]|nr:hypothetical protein BvCmsSINP031_03948 [Escherichia coli]